MAHKNISAPPEDVRRDRAADTFYWICTDIAAALFGWLRFWLNYHEIMAKCDPALAIPAAVLFASMVTIFSGVFGETLSRSGKYITESAMVIFFLIVTNPIRMIT